MMATAAPLHGRTVVVTGGSRGLGQAVVEAAREQGARVAYCARHVDATAAGGAPAANLLPVVADVSVAAEVEAFFAAVRHAFGPPDVVVINAGISRHALLAGSDTALFDEVMATNLTGAFLTSRAALAAFGARGGRLVFIGSIQATGSPRGAAAYAASKGGVEGLVAAIAADCAGTGVRATQLVAGFVDTDLTRELPPIARERFVALTPAHRLPSLAELADYVLFLASDAAAGLNGATLRATGGMRDMLL